MQAKLVERISGAPFLSTSAITTSLLSQIADSPSAANQFVTDLNQLAQDVQSGNLSAAQQDYVTLSEDALNGTGASTATTNASGITTSLLSDIASSPSSAASFVTELNQLGTDLQNGDTASAQQDLLGLDSTALNAAPSSTATNTAATIKVSTQAQSAALIRAIVQALGTGNDSVAGSDLSQLASLSPSAAGASALEQESESLGSSSSSTSSSSSVSQLLQSLNSSSSSSGLSLLA